VQGTASIFAPGIGTLLSVFKVNRIANFRSVDRVLNAISRRHCTEV